MGDLLQLEVTSSVTIIPRIETFFLPPMLLGACSSFATASSCQGWATKEETGAEGTYGPRMLTPTRMGAVGDRGKESEAAWDYSSKWFTGYLCRAIAPLESFSGFARV